MTREEARTALGDRNNLLWGMSKEERKHYSEALDMAISALSAEEDETHGESVFDAMMKRLHEHQENMFIYYDGDKQISKEEFETKFNNLWAVDDCMSIQTPDGINVTYHESRGKADE